jgi:hypothetical protein
MSTLMVRNVSGVPTVANFANMDGTPIVVDSDTGNAYTLVAGVVTLMGSQQGTWTPVLTFATPGNLSVAYSVQVGVYARTGNAFFIDAELVTSTFTHTTASGVLRVTGLPFTSAAAGSFRLALQWGGITKATYTDVVGVVSNGTTIVQFQASGSGVAPSNVTAADMPTGGSVVLRFSGLYLPA